LKAPRPSPETPVVVGKAYDFCLWMIQKVENFPRSFRFSVGDRLVATALDIQLRLVDAAYARHKAPILTEVNGMLNRLRYLVRIAKDLKLFSIDAYGHAAERIDEIGRMTGGWKKATAE